MDSNAQWQFKQREGRFAALGTQIHTRGGKPSLVHSWLLTHADMQALHEKGVPMPGWWQPVKPLDSNMFYKFYKAAS